MKLTSVDIVASNSVVNLSYRDPAAVNPFQVKEILGLDADEISAKFYRAADGAQGKYYDLTLPKRDVIVKIALNPSFALGKSYSTLRDDLYRMIASSRTGAVTLHFKNLNTIVAAVSGFIKKFESPQFSKSPEVQLTIECIDPMLRAVTQENIPVAGLDPKATVITDRFSTAPHGFRFGVKFGAATVNFSIQDAVPATWAFEIDLTGSPLGQFSMGDELHVSSEHNNRYAYLVRGVDIVQLADKIVPTSVWGILFHGPNSFLLSDFATWDYITHYPTYWGV